MTETTRPALVVPDGMDVVDDLTVGELDMIARKCGADVLLAVRGKGAEGTRRVITLAYLAWVWTKRSGRPDAKVEEFLNMRAGDLEYLLYGAPDDEAAPAGAPAEDPSSSTSESESS